MFNETYYIVITLAVINIACRHRVEVSPDLVMVRSFVHEVLDTCADFKAILAKCNCVNAEKGDSANRKEAIEMLTMVLKQTRERLKNKSRHVRSYVDIPFGLQTIQISDSRKKFAYVVIYKDKDIAPWYILVANGKIASFITMRKGSEMRYFLEFCL